MDPFNIDDDRWLLVHMPTAKVFCPGDKKNGYRLYVFSSEAQAEEHRSLMPDEHADNYVPLRFDAEFLRGIVQQCHNAGSTIRFISGREFNEIIRKHTRLAMLECN